MPPLTLDDIVKLFGTTLQTGLAPTQTIGDLVQGDIQRVLEESRRGAIGQRQKQMGQALQQQLQGQMGVTHGFGQGPQSTVSIEDALRQTQMPSLASAHVDATQGQPMRPTARTRTQLGPDPRSGAARGIPRLNMPEIADFLLGTQPITRNVMPEDGDAESAEDRRQGLADAALGIAERFPVGERAGRQEQDRADRPAGTPEDLRRTPSPRPMGAGPPPEPLMPTSDRKSDQAEMPSEDAPAGAEGAETEEGGGRDWLKYILPAITGGAAAVGSLVSDDFRRGLFGALPGGIEQERRRNEREEQVEIQRQELAMDFMKMASEMQTGDFRSTHNFLESINDPKQRFEVYKSMVRPEDRGEFQAQFPDFNPGSPTEMSQPDKRKYVAETAKSYQKEVSEMDRMTTAYKSLLDATDPTKKSGVYDNVALWQFIKSMDDSAVREGEVDMFLAGSPFADKIKMALSGDRAVFGKVLPPVVVEDIREIATKMYMHSKSRRDQMRQGAVQNAKYVTGLEDVEEMFPSYDADVPDDQILMLEMERRGRSR